MTDIIDRIDALTGYDFGDPTYPRCPHCGRHWHRLRLTRRISQMYATGRYDPDYTHAADDTPILCEGSEFIGPQRPPLNPWRVNGTVIDINTFILNVELPDPRRAPWWHWRIYHNSFELLHDSDPPAPTCPPDTDITIEFGPQNWAHEIRRTATQPHLPTELQFPRLHWPSPLERQVANLWPQFTAPNHPVPDTPGINAQAIQAHLDHPTTGPATPPPGRHHART